MMSFDDAVEAKNLRRMKLCFRKAFKTAQNEHTKK